jgi:flagellar basal-body rod protein FlgF
VDSGYYAVCAGLLSRMQALELAANNLANVNTSGFKGQQAMFRSLVQQAGITSPMNRAVNDFGILSGTALDLSAGNIDATGNDLDVAIEGKGFFAVQTAAGVRYTRNGRFQLTSQGELVTADGDPVLGGGGPITLPSGKVSISPDGTVSVDGAIAGQLKIVHGRRPEGHGRPPANNLHHADARQYAAENGSTSAGNSASREQRGRRLCHGQPSAVCRARHRT